MSLLFLITIAIQNEILEFFPDFLSEELSWSLKHFDSMIPFKYRIHIMKSKMNYNEREVDNMKIHIK